MGDLVQIVVTPRSGNGQALSNARHIQDALVRRGYEAQIQTFVEFDPLLRWAATCAPTFSHLVAVGGDATLSASAGAAVRLGIPFVPVPNGFGNIFARAFGHAEQPHRVIDLFERGRFCRIDVGTVDHDQIFLAHRSYGLLEEIQQAAERGVTLSKSRVLRHLAYYAMAKRFLFTAPLSAIRVEVDGTLVAEDAAVVTAANVETYRGYLSLTPSASPIDGLFDVCVIPRATKLAVLTRLFKLMFDLPGRWNDVLLCRGRCVRVIVDGQAPEVLTVRPRVLPLLVPQGSVESLKARQAAADVPCRGPAPAPREVMARRGAARRSPMQMQLARAPQRAPGSPRQSTPPAGHGARG